MKKSQKAAIAATIFYAAMNFNGCAYGPPEDELLDAALAKEKSAVYTIDADDSDNVQEQDGTVRA